MQKLQIIFRLTRTHAWNLARFVAVYKALLILLRRLLRHEQEWHSFVAGCVGGYLIFSRDVPVNNQACCGPSLPALNASVDCSLSPGSSGDGTVQAGVRSLGTRTTSRMPWRECIFLGGDDRLGPCDVAIPASSRHSATLAAVQHAVPVQRQRPLEQHLDPPHTQQMNPLTTTLKH